MASDSDELSEDLAREGTAALPALLSRLDTETDERVLSALVRAVGKLGNATHVPRIQRFLRAEERPGLVASTVEAIAALDPEVGFTLIVPLLNAKDSRV